jgi:hypothetical protein
MESNRGRGQGSLWTVARTEEEEGIIEVNFIRSGVISSLRVDEQICNRQCTEIYACTRAEQKHNLVYKSQFSVYGQVINT